MASTKIRVDGRLFKVRVDAFEHRSTYKCYFLEVRENKYLPNRYVTFNKNRAHKERDDIYDWFKEMVEENLPQEDEREVLREVVDGLSDEYEGVERNT